MIKIVYITSAKKGLPAFTFKELELLEKNDINFVLCLTQLQEGVFLPKKKWATYVPSKIKIFLFLFFFVINHPKKFIKLFSEAYSKRLCKWLIVSLFFYYKLKKHEISSIHCQMGGNKLYIGYFLSKLLNKKLTVTIHAYELYNEDAYSKIEVLSEIYNYCYRVITISEFNKNELITRFNVDSKKILVIYLYPANYENTYNKKKILVVGNWVKKKGYEFLFSAIEKLKRDDFVVWIVGGYIKDANAINLTKIVNEKALSTKIKLFGLQPSNIVNILLQSCDIFCLPSVTVFDNEGKVTDREGIPVSLMEAMKYGKPVISTYHAGIPELVEDYLVKENDVDDLINKINYLLDNPDIWEKIGKRNRSIVNTKFNIKNIQKLINVLKD